MFPRMNDSDRANEDIQRLEECYKVLLDADSDISFVTLITQHGDDRESNWFSAFWVALCQGTLVRRPYRDRFMQCI